jgi:O-antigen/teichoic acid export membrane protein
VLANSIFGCCAILLNMTGHHARVTRASAIALFMLFVLSPVLIDRSGYEGAALASAITALTWNALMWWDARRLLRLDTGLLSLFRQARGGAS